MTRVKTSIGIMLLLIALSLLSSLWVNSKCSAFLRDISRIEELCSEGKVDEAYRLTEDFEREWAQFRKYAAVILRSDRLTEVDRKAAGILCLMDESGGELESALSDLRHMLKTIKKCETPVFTSVF